MIVVEDLHKHFGGFRAVDGSSLEIALWGDALLRLGDLRLEGAAQMELMSHEVAQLPDSILPRQTSMSESEYERLRRDVESLRTELEVST